MGAVGCILLLIAGFLFVVIGRHEDKSLYILGGGFLMGSALLRLLALYT